MEPTTQNTAEVFLRLEEPFAPKEVKWLVAATSNDRKNGRVTPYADPRAYTDRLNAVVTPGGWTREYAVQTVSPISRVKNEKVIQTGKVLVTCTVSITGVGVHSANGEEWADDENAMTSAEAQAFKRACTCFGLGRYFYNFPELWVELNEKRQPRTTPTLPNWALPKGYAPENQEHVTRTQARDQKTSAPIAKGPLDAGVTAKIEEFRRELGLALYGNVMSMTAGARAAKDIPNQQAQRRALQWMESAARGMARIREIAAEIPETSFYDILDSHHVHSLAQVPDYNTLKALLEAMIKAAAEKSAA
jgi:hypothetical protein